MKNKQEATPVKSKEPVVTLEVVELTPNRQVPSTEGQPSVWVWNHTILGQGFPP